ncbi:MAG: 1-acyl-sn-glycerol-3-phosphate acyltransferase [Deltaproteobacteria bacterium]|nr:1-acyl-sn-glycerol-3-phosphate acyltransferase [Deltaproteobacteria bacterium]
MFARIGQVVGARRNFNDLLSNDELLAIFPEGTKGLGKPFSRRYQLARFNVGFIESALRYKAPIVPIAVVGAEEQLPMVGNLKPIARLFNFPYFPITPFFPLLGPIGMLPMPVQYHIYYGKPLHFYEEYSAETINEPEKVRMLAHQVQMTIQDMLIAGLDQRQSVFGFGAA